MNNDHPLPDYGDLIQRLRGMNKPTADEAANVITVLASLVTGLCQRASAPTVGLPARAPAKRPRKKTPPTSSGEAEGSAQ